MKLYRIKISQITAWDKLRNRVLQGASLTQIAEFAGIEDQIKSRLTKIEAQEN